MPFIHSASIHPSDMEVPHQHHDHAASILNVLPLLDCPWILFDRSGKVIARDISSFPFSVVHDNSDNAFDLLRLLTPDHWETIEAAVLSSAEPNANVSTRIENLNFIMLTVRRVNKSLYLMTLRPSTEIDYIASVGKAASWVDSKGVISSILIDEKGIIRSWNVSARSMFLYSKRDVIKQPLRELFSEDNHPLISQGLQFCMTSGWFEKDALLKRKDGSTFETRIIFARQRDTKYITFMASDLSWTTFVNKRLQEMAGRDDLTGALSRRYFLDIMNKELLRFGRYGGALSLLMIDADYFKRINDSHGHEAGDIVLRELVSILVETVRKVDSVARLGGEEFAILLPATDTSGALALAERLRSIVEQRRVLVQGKELSFTISIGVTSATHPQQDADVLLRAADQALYLAKNGGRNRVCLRLPETDEVCSGSSHPSVS